MAIGAQDAAILLGLKIGDDLAIVGHDGVSLSNWDSHSITTIMPPHRAVSDALIEFIERPTAAPPEQNVVNCVVRWRQSTGPTPG
jgi:DNA-binding LacI/PurR family transcriptional regulator